MENKATHAVNAAVKVEDFMSEPRVIKVYIYTCATSDYIDPGGGDKRDLTVG